MQKGYATGSNGVSDPNTTQPGVLSSLQSTATTTSKIYLATAQEAIQPHLKSAQEAIQPYFESAQAIVQPHGETAINAAKPYAEKSQSTLASAIGPSNRNEKDRTS